MQYTTLGNTGLVVSRLALGAMTFGQGPLVGDWKTEIDQDTASRMVHQALDAGVNVFDTADMYTSGQSEIMLGKALKGLRQDVVIATKCGFRSGPGVNAAGLSYDYVLKAIAASLKRLGTDWIDLYIMHIPDPWTPLEETARALEHAVNKGWVRYTALSNFPAWQAQKLIDIQKSYDWKPLCAMQMYYSLLGRDIEAEVLPMIRSNDLGLLTWSPLASGFLTGKYTRENPVPEGSRRATFDFPPVDLETGYRVVDRLKEIAGAHGASVAQAALAWLLAKQEVSCVLVGANSMDQLADNLSAAGLELTADEVAALDELSTPALSYPAWMQPMGRDAAKAEAMAKRS